VRSGLAGHGQCQTQRRRPGCFRPDRRSWALPPPAVRAGMAPSLLAQGRHPRPPRKDACGARRPARMAKPPRDPVGRTCRPRVLAPYQRLSEPRQALASVRGRIQRRCTELRTADRAIRRPQSDTALRHRPSLPLASRRCSDLWRGDSRAAYDPIVPRTVSAVALLASAAALVIASIALREARRPTEPPTYAEITAAAVHQFTASGNRMAPAEVLRLLGKPDGVYRNNSRALCWSYTAPYKIRMCWGPKRERAWIATNIGPGA
jgi:hypothetical protein